MNQQNYGSIVSATSSGSGMALPTPSVSAIESLNSRLSEAVSYANRIAYSVEIIGNQVVGARAENAVIGDKISPVASSTMERLDELEIALSRIDSMAQRLS